LRLPFYQLDAFEDGPFTGNPAAVCLLEEWLVDGTLQAIAEENNLSETAYIRRGDERDWHIRWFTPACEVDLCGHATLAAGAVILDRLDTGATGAVLHSPRAGRLAVRRRPEGFELDFPIWPATCADPAPLGDALGAMPAAAFAGHYCMAVYGSADAVSGLAPDMDAIRDLPVEGVIATAPGGDVDFVSRFFGPRVGVPEDPVTGSAHSMLTPYWAERTGRTVLAARQLSRRGGRLRCELRGERVGIAGSVRFVVEGGFTI
jgi:predicted PhzF superfamily epimerase YddE/YHI9